VEPFGTLIGWQIHDVGARDRRGRKHDHHEKHDKRFHHRTGPSRAAIPEAWRLQLSVPRIFSRLWLGALFSKVEVSATGTSVQGRSPMGSLPLVGRKASLVRG
jgi:hypothetical protein